MILIQKFFKKFVLANFIFLISLCSIGCALKKYNLASFLDKDLPPKVLISKVPFYPQKKYQCGPSALAMVMAWNGQDLSPQELKNEVYAPKRKGTLQPALKAAARQHGKIAYEIYGLDELLLELAARHPVIILQNLGLSWFPKWHYAVVIGYDLKQELIILHSGQTKGQKQEFQTFLHTWRRGNYWGLLVLKPGVMPASLKQDRYFDAVLGLESAGKWKAASRAYKKALSRWPKNLVALMGRGNCLYQLEDLHYAKQIFRRTTKIHPRTPEAYNNLAQVLMELGEFKRALQASRIAVSLGGARQDIYKKTLREIKSHNHSKN